MKTWAYTTNQNCNYQLKIECWQPASQNWPSAGVFTKENQFRKHIKARYLAKLSSVFLLPMFTGCHLNLAATTCILLPNNFI